MNGGRFDDTGISSSIVITICSTSKRVGRRASVPFARRRTSGTNVSTAVVTTSRRRSIAATPPLEELKGISTEVLPAETVMFAIAEERGPVLMSRKVPRKRRKSWGMMFPDEAEGPDVLDSMPCPVCAIDHPPSHSSGELEAVARLHRNGV